MWADNNDGELQYIETVTDDVYKAGWFGCCAEGTGHYIYNFTLDFHRSTSIILPVNAYDYNQIRMYASDQLDDDELLTATSRKVVSSSNPIMFRLPSYSSDTSTEVRVWDNMNEALQADWERVYHTDHKFTGDIIIDNGLIRINLDVTSTGEFKLQVYSNGSWENITFDPAWSSLTFDNVDYGFTLLTKHQVILREASYYETSAGFDMVWTDYTITSGSPMVQIENRRAL